MFTLYIKDTRRIHKNPQKSPESTISKKSTQNKTSKHNLQINLEKDFGYTDDDVVKELSEALSDLGSKRMDTAGRPNDDELPKSPFGLAAQQERHLTFRYCRNSKYRVVRPVRDNILLTFDYKPAPMVVVVVGTY